MYQYYAFREVNLEFVPNLYPGQTGSNNNMYMAILQDYDSAASNLTDDGGLPQKIAQIVPSVVFTAWKGATLTYKFNGKRLWETDVNGSDPEVYTQMTLCGGANSPLNTAIWADLRITYVVDFYIPTFIDSTPALRISRSLSYVEETVRALLSEKKDHKFSLEDLIHPKRRREMSDFAHERQMLTLVQDVLIPFFRDNPKAKSRRVVLDLRPIVEDSEIEESDFVTELSPPSSSSSSASSSSQVSSTRAPATAPRRPRVVVPVREIRS